MNTFDPLAVPVTALERKIVAGVRRLDIVSQSQVLLIVQALNAGHITNLDVAEALHLGGKALSDLVTLLAAEMPPGAKAA